MTNLRFLWNPFSKKTKNAKAQAKEARDRALALHKDAVEKKALHDEMYREQKELSNELRKEQRKNHFADMFRTTVPLRNSDQ